MTIRLHALAAAALLLALAPSLGCRTTHSNPAAASPTGTYTVGPPDRLLVTVLPEPVISRNVTVRPDGMISFDLVGDVPVTGRTLEEIAADMQQRMRRYKKGATVTVFLAGSASTVITILGESNRQDTMPLPRETRLIEIMGVVGGWRTSAAASRIRIVRQEGGGTPVVLTADLDAILRGDMRTNYLLRAGDIVFLPRNLSAAIGMAMAKAIAPVSGLLNLGIQGGRIAILVQSGGASALAGKAFGGVPMMGLVGGF